MKINIDKRLNISKMSPMLYTTSSLSKYLGVSRFTIFKQLKRGVIKFQWLSKTVIVITQEEADKWLEQKRIHAGRRSFFPVKGKLGRPRKNGKIY